MDISEKNFETTIEQVLHNGLPPPKGEKYRNQPRMCHVPGGFRKRIPE